MKSTAHGRAVSENPHLATPALVVVIDDDPMVRGSMDSLFRSVGMRTKLYESARDALAAPLPDEVCCFVVDIRLPHIGGLEFQSALSARGDDPTIIFVTGHGDIPMSVRAMKAGAADFLSKPFRDQELLDAVTRALDRDRERREQNERRSSIRSRYEKLSPRERQVMRHVSAGRMNKQVAGELGLSDITVKLHRANMMKKMEAYTVVDLVLMWETLESDFRTLL